MFRLHFSRDFSNASQTRENVMLCYTEDLLLTFQLNGDPTLTFDAYYILNDLDKFI